MNGPCELQCQLKMGRWIVFLLDKLMFLIIRNCPDLKTTKDGTLSFTSTHTNTLNIWKSDQTSCFLFIHKQQHLFVDIICSVPSLGLDKVSELARCGTSPPPRNLIWNLVPTGVKAGLLLSEPIQFLLESQSINHKKTQTTTNDYKMTDPIVPQRHTACSCFVWRNGGSILIICPWL